MTDIFDEVAEDLRRDRATEMWKRFAPAIIGVAVLIVVGVAGYRGWEWYSANQGAESGDRFAAALTLAEDGKDAEAKAALQAIAADGPWGYATLAKFRAASATAAEDRAQGIAAFEALAKDQALNASLRDLATLRAGMLEIESADYAAVRQRLEPLAMAGKPWRHQARETLAFSALGSGDTAEARRWADATLADAQVPPGTRARVQIIIELLADSAPAASAAS